MLRKVCVRLGQYVGMCGKICGTICGTQKNWKIFNFFKVFKYFIFTILKLFFMKNMMILWVPNGLKND